MARISDGAKSPVLEDDCGQQIFGQVNLNISEMRHCCCRHQGIEKTSTIKKHDGSGSVNFGSASTAGAIMQTIRAVQRKEEKAAVQATDMAETSLRGQLVQ
jgi:hypothetical protein